MTQNPDDILQKIIAHKTLEVTAAKQALPLTTIKQQLVDLAPTRNFAAAIAAKIAAKKPAIIAEIKKASPSKGIIRTNFDPEFLAKNYEEYGATCLSILTDQQFFHGHDDYLTQVRKISSLPLLRKEFIIDPYQIYQSRLIGADCILLIVSVLTDQQLQDFTELANELKLSILIEVHDLAELKRILPLNTPLIGINNRNLRTFVTDLNNTLTLLSHIPYNKIVISESGISKITDVKLLEQHNVYGFLIGESFMREENPGQKLQELFFSYPS